MIQEEIDDSGQMSISAEIAQKNRISNYEKLKTKFDTKEDSSGKTFRKKLKQELQGKPWEWSNNKAGDVAQSVTNDVLKHIRNITPVIPQESLTPPQTSQPTPELAPAPQENLTTPQTSQPTPELAPAPQQSPVTESVVENGQPTTPPKKDTKSASKIGVKKNAQVREDASVDEKYTKSGSKQAEKLISIQETLTAIESDRRDLKQQEVELLKEYGILTEEEETTRTKKIEKYNKLLEEERELRILGTSATAEQQERLQEIAEEKQEYNRQEIEEWSSQIKAIETIRKKAKTLSEEYDSQKKEISSLVKGEESRIFQIEEGIKSTKNLKSVMSQLASVFGSNSTEVANFQQVMDRTNTQMSVFYHSVRDLDADSQSMVANAMSSYKDFLSVQANLQAQRKNGEITEEQYRQKLQDSALTAQRTLSSIATTVQEMPQEVQAVFAEMQSVVNAIPTGISAGIQNIDTMKKALEEMKGAFGKNAEQVATMERTIQQAKLQMSAFSDEARNLSVEQQEVLAKGLDAFKQFQTTQLQLQTQLKTGVINLAEYNQKLREASESAQQGMRSIAGIVEELGPAVENVFGNMTTQINDTREAAEKLGVALQAKNDAISKLGSSGVPIFDDVVNNLENISKGGAAAALAIGAIAGAAAGVAFDYFAAPLTVARDAEIAVRQERINTEMAILDIQNKAAFSRQRAEQSILEQRQSTFEQVAQLENEAKFAGQKALIAYNNQLAQQAVQFKAQAKLALAGRGLGKIGYTAKQLSIIGVGAGEIEEAFKAMGNVTGQMETNMKGMPVQELASSMAVFSKRTGVSSDILSSINFALQQSEGLTAEAALNMQAGMETVARNAGIADFAGYMGEVAEASKNMYSYGIKNASSLARQVAFTKSMGLNFNAIADAGKNMVLNYQDSIKAEMELSVMLGESIDLSEVRAAFAKGGDEGVIEGIKAMQRIGLDIGEMDMFQLDQLQKTFGVDLGSIKTIMTTSGKDIDQLSATDIKTGNQQFIEKTKIVTQNQEVETANLTAAQAIVDAQLSGKIAETYLNSKEYQDVLARQAIVAAKAAELDLMIGNALKLLPAYQDAQVRLAQLNVESQFNWLNILKVAGQGLMTFVAGIAAMKFMGGGGFGGFGGFGGGGGGGGGGGKGFKMSRGGWIGAGLTVATLLGGYIYSKSGSDEEDSSEMSPEEKLAYQEQERGREESQRAMDNAYKALNTSILTQTTSTKDLAQTMKELGMDTTQGPGIVGMSGMISEPSGICSCASAIIDVLETQLEQMREQMKLEEEGWKQYDERLGAQISDANAGMLTATLEYTGASIATASVGSVIENAFAKAATKVTFGEALKRTFRGPALKTMGTGIALGVAGDIMDIYGEAKMQEGRDKGNLEIYNTGRMLESVSDGLTTAAFVTPFAGAIASGIGAMLPAAAATSWSGVGALVVGAVAFLGGLTWGLYENYWSDEAEAAAEQVRLQNIANDFNKMMAETDLKAYELTVERLKEAEFSKSIAENEKVWRQSMLAQTIEMTRLLDLMAQKQLGDGLGNYKINGQEVRLGEYNKAQTIAASELGIGPELTEKEKIIQQLLADTKDGIVSVSSTLKTKDGATIGGQEYESAMTTLGISLKDIQAYKNKAELIKVAGLKAQQIQVENAIKELQKTGGEVTEREYFISSLVDATKQGTQSIASDATLSYKGKTFGGKSIEQVMSSLNISKEELNKAVYRKQLSDIASGKQSSSVSQPQQSISTTGTPTIPFAPTPLAPYSPLPLVQPMSINPPVVPSVNTTPQKVIAMWPAEPLSLLTAVKTAIVALPKTKEGLLRVTDEAANSKLGKIDTNVKLMSDNTEAIKKLTEVMANIAAAEATTSGLLTTAGGKIEFNIDGKKVFSAMNDVVNRMTGMLPTTAGQ